jgi:arsenite-transporting ATPase
MIDGLLHQATRFLFFTGKGGVGKTTLASAVSVALADAGLRTLLISTDPASNLDEVLETVLGNEPRPVPQVPNLSAMNILHHRDCQLQRVHPPRRRRGSH